ncbi:MAG TPA: hypothetical protein VK338_01085, partial [Candidatus Nitrosocosmicus sp.]|nr:hypothetical protein [Candidatus Nitrosocosmicus sp.]
MTKKQSHELTRKDLEKYPIWEFPYYKNAVGMYEATVIPRPDLKSPNDPDSLFIVKTEFIANNGKKYIGYITPHKEKYIGYIAPTIVTDSQQVMLWYGVMKPSKDELNDAYKVLNTNKNDLFPLKFKV